jgi:hypothetical protein
MNLVDSLINFSSQVKRLGVVTHFRFMSHSLNNQNYSSKLEELEKFIKLNNLENCRLDWV